MKITIRIAAIAAAMLAAAYAVGCTSAGGGERDETPDSPSTEGAENSGSAGGESTEESGGEVGGESTEENGGEVGGESTEESGGEVGGESTEESGGEVGDENTEESGGETGGGEQLQPPEVAEPEYPDDNGEEEVQPAVQTVAYIRVTGDGVNIRTGAGTGFSSLGAAEKDTLYALDGVENGWYITRYRNKTAYISSKYCEEVYFERADDKIENVISVGEGLLGTPYVYGATRLHDGKGNMYGGFTVNAFDCSSLMQYMFYYGADMLLDVNTRTQVYQGVTIQRSNLERGDLIFFTNSSRVDKTGIERIGHVAMYLGDNYILHTSSDYAKIEQISSQRWSYYIQAQRMI